nr:hypothetical protein [Brucella pseudintermedia]
MEQNVVSQNRPVALLSLLKDIGDDMVAKRARRIADKLRMKAKCRRLYPHDKKARAAEYLAVCSCAMCGNPRRYFGEKTIQERRFAAFAAE